MAKNKSGNSYPINVAGRSSGLKGRGETMLVIIWVKVNLKKKKPLASRAKARN